MHANGLSTTYGAQNGELVVLLQFRRTSDLQVLLGDILARSDVWASQGSSRPRCGKGKQTLLLRRAAGKGLILTHDKKPL